MNPTSTPDAFRSTYSGGDLLEQSKAKPSAELNWERIDAKLAESRSSSKSQPKVRYDSDAYLKQCREEDPWPEEKQKTSGGITLSDCRFLFPSSLYPDYETVVQCRVSQGDSPVIGAVGFKLFVRLEGEEDWIDLHETATGLVEAKTGDVLVNADIVLHCPTPAPPLGTKLEYRILAEESGGSTAESAPVTVALQNLCRYLGTPHLNWKDRHIVPVLDEDGKWALGLATLLKVHEKKIGSTLVAFGFAHGSNARELGRHRAEWVRCVLSRDKTGWKELCRKMNARDLQAILLGLCLGYGWNCDPGVVDGKMGSFTTVGIKGFQIACQARLGTMIKPDGNPSEKTWEALLDALCHCVGEAMGDAESSDPSWQIPTWGHCSGNGIFSNGADFAREEDLGVEVCLFEPGMEPLLKPPTGGRKVDSASNPMEDRARVQKVSLVVLDPPTLPNHVRRVRLVGMIFDSDKGFVLPQALPGMKMVVAMHKQFPQARVLVVGHAESDEIHAGIDLACHRAEMLIAYLLGRIEPWLACFGPSQIAVSRWGIREVQLMLSALDCEGGCWYEGCASGIMDEKTKSAITAFQRSKGLKEDGIVGPKTREAIVRAYLDLEGTTLAADATPTPHGCKDHPDTSIGESGLVVDGRRIEVFFFERKIKPRPIKSISGEADLEYPQWISCLEETRDFEVHGVHVQVLDGNKKPRTGLPVVLSGPVELSSETDAHGYASFLGLKAGRYVLKSANSEKPIPEIALNYPTAKTVDGKQPRNDRRQH